MRARLSGFTTSSGLIARAAAVLLLGPFASAAGTLHVPADRPTIQAGIDAAATGDTVLVACAAYDEHDLVMKSGVVLRSAGGVASCVTINGYGSARVMSCSHVTDAAIEGFTFRGGSTSGYGGGLYCEFSSLAIRNCKFAQNSAVSGGALVCHMTSAEVVDCEFTGNSSAGGGAIVVTYPSAFTLTRCTISQNTATQRGGGMSVAYGATPVVTDCVFSSNTGGVYGLSGGYGGAVTCETGSHPRFVNCRFLQNLAQFDGQGAAVRCVAASADFTNCLFQGNSTDGPVGGGALYLDAATVAISNCTFRDNHSPSVGGGILAVATDATISESVFEANYAERGGGIKCRAGGAITLDRCRFTGNHGYYDWGGGGAVMVESSSPLMTGCVFDQNDAGSGGAIWVFNTGSDPEIRNCTLVRNTGPCASAVAVTDGAWATLRNCIISYNEDAPAVKCFMTTFCWFNPGYIRVFCTDIWGNPDGDWVDCINPQRTMNGNLSANPIFCDISHGDLHLYSRSPCAPALQPACGLIGALDVACYGSTSVPPATPLTWGRTKAIFR